MSGVRLLSLSKSLKSRLIGCSYLLEYARSDAGIFFCVICYIYNRKSINLYYYWFCVKNTTYNFTINEMDKVKYIVVHCSATKEGMDYRARDIDRWHRERGFNSIGYHYVIDLDGCIEQGRGINQMGAHVKGHNNESIGVCYIGGLDASGEPKDTRTAAQKQSLNDLLTVLKRMFPDAVIQGHRDFSPDLNKNGVIEKSEWMKDCPCFDAKEEYKEI